MNDKSFLHVLASYRLDFGYCVYLPHMSSEEGTEKFTIIFSSTSRNYLIIGGDQTHEKSYTYGVYGIE